MVLCFGNNEQNDRYSYCRSKDNSPKIVRWRRVALEETTKCWVSYNHQYILLCFSTRLLSRAMLELSWIQHQHNVQLINQVRYIYVTLNWFVRVKLWFIIDFQFQFLSWFVVALCSFAFRVCRKGKTKLVSHLSWLHNLSSSSSPRVTHITVDSIAFDRPKNWYIQLTNRLKYHR